MSFMDDDDKNAQLTRTFFSANEEEAANIKLAMSNIPAPFQGGQTFIPPSMEVPRPIVPTSNSVEKDTVFENPKELQANIKDNGKLNNGFKRILQFQQPVKVDDAPDERTQNALVTLTKERTFGTPYLNQLKNRIIVSQVSIDTKFRVLTKHMRYSLNLFYFLVWVFVFCLRFHLCLFWSYRLRGFGTFLCLFEDSFFV